MKLSRVRPCDRCGGPLTDPATRSNHFHVVRSSLAMVKPQALREVTGLQAIFAGRLGMAEVFAPDPEVILVLGDQEPDLMTEMFLCFECYCDTGLAEVAERMSAKRSKEAGKELVR